MLTCIVTEPVTDIGWWFEETRDSGPDRSVYEVDGLLASAPDNYKVG